MLPEQEPTHSDWTFWLKSKIVSTADATQPPTIYVSAQHIHGPYVLDKQNQIPLLRDNILAHMPEWVDDIWWHSEWYEIPLDINLKRKKSY